MNITVTFRSGEVKYFLHEGRPGGSYTKSVKFEPGFVIIEDEWGTQTIYPSDLVAEVRTEPTRYR